jgi:hypothetical protein
VNGLIRDVVRHLGCDTTSYAVRCAQQGWVRLYVAHTRRTLQVAA